MQIDVALSYALDTRIIVVFMYITLTIMGVLRRSEQWLEIQGNLLQ